MVQALSNFFTYSEQRSKIYPAECISEPMSPVNIQVYRLTIITRKYYNMKSAKYNSFQQLEKIDLLENNHVQNFYEDSVIDMTVL